MIFLLGYIIIELIEGVYSNFFEYYRIKFNLNINLKVKELIMSKISKLKLQDFEDSETYDVINRARNESEGKVSSLSIFSGKVIFKDMMLI
jgi:putative lantibiotic ABC transporter, ATP-binding protein